jgi:hypothetical protein
MKLSRFRVPTVAVIAGLTVWPACAATLRWANDGDVNAMDPATRQETVQLSFLSNIYEPLVRRDRRWLPPGSKSRQLSGASTCAPG